MSSAFREFAGHEVHERGMALTGMMWGLVLCMPEMCDLLDEEMPEWAMDLWNHAAVIESMTPRPLRDALLEAVQRKAAVPCDLVAALRGVELDVCTLAPTTGNTAQIVSTPLGLAVTVLAQHREDDPDDPGEYDA